MDESSERPTAGGVARRRLENAPVPDSIEWVQFSDGDTGKTYYWNRRSNLTAWQPPVGIEVVWVGTRDEKRGSSTAGTRSSVSVRMTFLHFLLGEGWHRQPRAVFKYWAPYRLCCVETFFTVNNGHWFCHPRGTLLVLEAITMVQLTLALWVHVHFRAVWTTINSLSVSFCDDGFSDDLTEYGPSFLAVTFPVSSREEHRYAEFSGRSLPDTFPYSVLLFTTVDTRSASLRSLFGNRDRFAPSFADEKVAARRLQRWYGCFAGYDAPRAMLAFHAVFYSLSAGPSFSASWSLTGSFAPTRGDPTGAVLGPV